MRRLARRVRAFAVVGVAALLLAGGTAAPRALATLEVFRVRQVEVTGTRFLEPYTVVKAAGLNRASSVFDDDARWRAGILTLPLVADAAVRRQLPSTVRIEVREVEPVALVAAPELRAVDAAGRVVALDPAGAHLDLPILMGVEVRGGRVAAPEGLQVLDALVALRRDAPELADRVSQIERAPGLLRLVFRDGSAEALLPPDASEVQLRQLRLAVADLASRGELGSVHRIDLRFRDQVVVSFLTRPVS